MITAAATDTAFTQSSPLSPGEPDTLGQGAFLDLLVTQIQMQDPFEPLSSRDLIAQLAQFSSVEQLEKMNVQMIFLQQAQATSQALLLIGRNVTTGEDGVTGVVDGVSFADGQPKLLIGDQQIDPGDVVRVW